MESPVRVVIGRMTQIRENSNIYVDNIVLKKMPSSLYEVTPLTTTEGGDSVLASGTIHPEIAIGTIGTVSNATVVLRYRYTGDTAWTDRPMELDGSVYHVQGGSFTVDANSNIQLEMCVVATYNNEEEGVHTAEMTYTEDHPLVLDLLPHGILAGHDNLSITGAFPLEMSIVSNGVWTGGYELSGGVQDSSFAFDFGSIRYGVAGYAIPFSRVVSGGLSCAAPETITRDVIFHYDETGNLMGTALYGLYQTFEDWENTGATNGWSISAATSSIVETNETVAAQTGAHALFLKAGDTLYLDKSALVGVGEFGFWFRRADGGTNTAGVTVGRRLKGSQTYLNFGTYKGLATDRYTFVRRPLANAESPMQTDGLSFMADTDVYLDNVYVTDCSTVLFGDFSIEPQPIRQNTPVTVTATFSVAGGGKLKTGTVLLKYGQGNDPSCATEEGVFSNPSDDGVTWICELTDGVDRSDADFYAYVTADAQDYRGANIGSVTSATNCIPVIPYSDVEGVSIVSANSSTPMRLAADRFWKGALPSGTPATATYWFLDSTNGVKRGDAGATTAPSHGALTEDAEFALSGISTALAFEYNEAEQTYRIQQAHYDPMTSTTAASPAWTRTGVTAVTNFNGCLRYNAGGTFITPTRPGVGQIMFWAARAGANPATFTVDVSNENTGNTWRSVSTGNTIASESMRFFSVLIGDPDVRRIRVTFNGATAYVQDAIVTASGSFVTMTDAKFSTNSVDWVASVPNGPTISYGYRPYLSVSVAPENGAHDISVAVEAVTADIVNGAVVVDPMADIVSVPMQGDPDGGVFSVRMPALVAGATAYRFVATFDGEDAQPATYPKDGTWYSYVTDTELEAIREPNYSKLDHDNDVLGGRYVDNWRVNQVYLWSSRPATIGFTPTEGQTYIQSQTAFVGIGRIYFKAYCISQYGNHELEVQLSEDGATWDTINYVDIPYGAGVGLTPFTQFCIEVNDYGNKYIRIVRHTPGANEEDYIYLQDLVVTPPTANIRAKIPSIIHPGYPSKDKDITFKVNVANVYASYPAANAKVTLHWRRVFGSVNQEWQSTPMAAVGGAIEDSEEGQDFSVTLPAMNPGRLEYYVSVSFSGASYRYPYNSSLPLRFYEAGDDAYLEEDARNGNESCTPTYLFARRANQEEFTHVTEQRALEAPTDYEYRYLWFKVRAFESQHDHLQIVYTNAYDTVAAGARPPVYTNELELIGNNLWLTTIPLSTNIDFLARIEGVNPYEGDGTTEYGAVPTVWGDDDQETINPPFASYAGTEEAKEVEIKLGTDNPVTMMVRLDATTGSYQVRRAAYQNFNDWGADTTYFEDSLGLFDIQNYEQGFDGSALYPETTYTPVVIDFQDDATGEYRNKYTTRGWNLRFGSILRERLPRVKGDLAGNVAVSIDQGGYIQNEAGLGALSDGAEYVSLRTRASFGGDGNTPYPRDGFAWENYTFAASNITVSALSDANPYIQVMAGYRDPYDYYALRLTQTAIINENGTFPHVLQQLIKVENGVETVLSSSYTRAFNDKNNALLTKESDGKTMQIELTKGAWTVLMSLQNGTVTARAFIPNTTWTNTVLTGSAPWSGGTVSFDSFDAVAEFRNLWYIEPGAARGTQLVTGDWYLGGPQAGNASQTRWAASANNTAVTHVLPALTYTIGVAKAGTSASLPAGAEYETGDPLAVGSLAYTTATKTVHYWGNTFVRIEPALSDASLVVDDIEIKGWRGRDLPEENPSNNSYWQAREAAIVTHNGSRALALTTSRANPQARQMVMTPVMADGLGTFSFNYSVEGGTVKFFVERNSASGAYATNANYVVVEGGEITAYAGSSGTVYLPIRQNITGKIRVRVDGEGSDEDATLYIDNLFAKSYPEDDGRSWGAYNALIVAPTRNPLVDEKQFEEDMTTQTAFLNNSVDGNTRQNTSYIEHEPYIQSPVIDTGVGEIAFWYRAWNPAYPTPGQITFWVAEHPDDPDDRWRQITEDDFAIPERDPGMSDREYYGSDAYIAYTNQVAAFRALSNITNGDYQYFSAEICNDTNYVLRICSTTNDAQRVAIDNVIVTEPVRASIEVLSVGMYPNDIPLADEDVGFEVLLGNPRMNPTDIHVYADYYIGTNRWGVANWAVTEAGTNIYESTELVQDANNPYLYRSSIGDMVPGKPVDTVVQYRIRVTYTGTFASPVTSAAFDYPEWYEPVDLNVDYADQGFSPYYWVFSCPTGCVFINEFYPSGGSSYHNSEYIEIIGPAKASIGGWKIDLVDGDTVSREEDYVTATYDLPADARFIAPAESTHGWGFYVAGDTECIESNKVNYVFADHAAQNLLTPGGIRIRRSMGAYVDRVSWGSTGRPAGNEMPKRGYRYAGTRGTYGSALRRSFALLVESSEEQGDYLAFALADIGVTTLGEMNTLSAAELWGDCPYSFAEAFTDASVEALNEYFDKYTSSSDYADLLYELTLNDATKLLALSIDEATLTLDTDFTIEALGDNALTITIAKESLLALNLSTNETHIVTFDVDGGIDPAVELLVKDTRPESSGNKSSDVSIEISNIAVANGKVTLTVTIVNNEPGKTVEGWSWGVKSASTLDALDAASPGALAPLTDAAILAPLTTELNATGDAQFYRGVLDDGE